MPCRDLVPYDPPQPRAAVDPYNDGNTQNKPRARFARRMIALLVVTDIAVSSPPLYALGIAAVLLVVGVVMLVRALSGVEVTAGVAVHIARREDKMLGAAGVDAEAAPSVREPIRYER